MFPRLHRGDATAADLTEDLYELHAAHPGLTEATIGRCRSGSGHTGYDILLDQLDPDHLAVADLGCGNGPLLEGLAALPHLTRIVGVDGCAAELARVRTADPRVELGAELPEGLDAVLSHHAFYLMRPPEAVIARLARSIRPGGLFAWITASARGGEHPIWVEMMTIMAELVSQTAPPFPGWGDRRQWTPAGRDALFAGPEWEPLETRDFVLLHRDTPERIMDLVGGFYYSAWLVDRTELRARWAPLLRPDPDGMLTFEWPWACVRARRAA